MNGIVIFSIAYFAIGLIVATIASRVMQPKVRFLNVLLTYPIFVVVLLLIEVFSKDSMRIEYSNGTYAVHFRKRNGYFGGYTSLNIAKQVVYEVAKTKRVVFIHLLPRTWWAVKI